MFQTIVLQASPSEGFGGMMLPMLALLVVFYLFMILPQNRKRKKEKKFITINNYKEFKNELIKF